MHTPPGIAALAHVVPSETASRMAPSSTETLARQRSAIYSAANGVLEDSTRAFYCHALTAMAQAGIPFLVGGAYAFARYTGIERHTKDFDVFVHPRDVNAVMRAIEQAGYQTESTFPHWIGKAWCGEDFVDIIHSSGNAVAEVDDEWFEHAVEDEVFGIPVKLVPAEEMIWSKAFIQERERFDGADVVHVLHQRADQLNWKRLLRRFGPYWRVLLQHLVVFGFIYPSEQHRIPPAVMRLLLGRLEHELAMPGAKAKTEKICRGTILSRQQYLPDVDNWGYEDVRNLPENPMTPDDIDLWTAGIVVDGA